MDAEKQSRERKTLSRDTEVVESQHLQKAAGWGGLGKSRLGPSVQEHQYPRAGVQALPYVHLGDKEAFHRGSNMCCKKIILVSRRDRILCLYISVLHAQ